jgi:leucyl/phenylalanyl-tRNA--protein transferase
MPYFHLSNSISFPPPQLAGEEGLLAIGGDLSRKRLLLAYKMGIFPWYSEDQPILWWSPDPRLILYPEDIRVSKSLKKIIRKEKFKITMDTAFEDVIKACATVRTANDEETWIVDDMLNSYIDLHNAGYAHSVEAWFDGELAGGLYGVSLGRCFFGESMFTRVSNASKVAFVTLAEFLAKLSFEFIDCQVKTDHLINFGSIEISRARFLTMLKQSLKRESMIGKWSFDMAD